MCGFVMIVIFFIFVLIELSYGFDICLFDGFVTIVFGILDFMYLYCEHVRFLFLFIVFFCYVFVLIRFFVFVPDCVYCIKWVVVWFCVFCEKLVRRNMMILLMVSCKCWKVDISKCWINCSKG